MEPIRPKLFNTLFSRTPLVALSEIPNVKITGVTSDSRQVQPGFAFVAIKGETVDGNDFACPAIDRGAALVVSSEPKPAGFDNPYLQVEGDARRALAYLSAAIHNFPARKLFMIGVTGTDGKTTTASMIHHILTQAGIKAGMISTVSALIGEEELETGYHVTTPDAPQIQGYLDEMVQVGMTHCVLEATSHGLAQGRVTAADMDVAVVTNVTHEHLDYHGSYEKYLGAKGILFEGLKLTPRKRQGNIRKAVLNKDDQSYGYLKRLVRNNYTSYSCVNEADLWADEIENAPTELRFTLHMGEKTWQVKTSAIGAYNVANCLAALTACISCLGIDVDAAVRSLESLPVVPGRMETIDLGQNFTAIVDFAHTPNALANALRTARAITKGKVITVYGSAGLRDVQKRKMMPTTSIQGADISILTAEDPRTEALSAILQDMADAAIAAGGVEGESFWRVRDRGDAIRKAIELAEKGDVVIVCGKGHEQSMCFGTQEYNWDDRTAMRAALAEHLGKPGPKMPWLPTSI